MILVTGATGNVGRETVRLLLEAGINTAAVSRDPETTRLPAGARRVAGDPSHPHTLAAELSGVEALLLVPRAVGDATAELLRLAAERGVRWVVALSAMTVAHPAGHRRFIAEFAAVEDAVRASGLRWTILRCADFAANALAWSAQIRSGAVVRGAHGDAATSTVDERDIAAVAARALRDPAHGGRSYLLTGPAPVTQRDKVGMIGAAVGRSLSFVDLPAEQVRRAMLAQGLPSDVPDRLLGSLADYAVHPGPTSAAVEQILARPARSFATWATDHAAAFRGAGDGADSPS